MLDLSNFAISCVAFKDHIHYKEGKRKGRTMARGLVKYSVDYRIKIIELASRGLQLQEIALALGIARSTLHRWLSRDDKLKRTVELKQREAFEDAVRVGINKLAKGYTKEETTDEYIIEDAQGRTVKRKVRRVEIDPSLNAMKLGAKLYDLPELSDSPQDNVTNILQVKTDTLSMREVQELLTNSPSNVSNLEDSIELAASDYKDLEDAESDEAPPSSGNDSE